MNPQNDLLSYIPYRAVAQAYATAIQIQSSEQAFCKVSEFRNFLQRTGVSVATNGLSFSPTFNAEQYALKLINFICICSVNKFEGYMMNSQTLYAIEHHALSIIKATRLDEYYSVAINDDFVSFRVERKR